MPHIGRVFVSHASIDKPFVDRLVADLTAHSVPVWYDRLDLRIGESVPGKINQGIADAKYFAIVLTPAAVSSAWVTEELNAALMKQVSTGGTFVIPILLKDCAIPPLLAHRKYADFRGEYVLALAELLELWGKDAEACTAASRDAVYPWPDLDMPDEEFVYLHSSRFDKFFRMSCSRAWTVRRTIQYLTDTLSLPWTKEIPELGMKWMFIYSIRLNGKSLAVSETLEESGIVNGSVLQIGIDGRYEDLYEKELKDMWDGSKIYLMTPEIMARSEWLKAQVAARQQLNRDQLKNIADSCFSHV